MLMASNELPNDVDALKSLVAKQAVRNEQLASKVILLQEQLNLALAKRYAASSEKISPDQVCLFDEPEVEIPATDDTDDIIVVPAHTRKKCGRKPLPDNLPRVIPDGLGARIDRSAWLVPRLFTSIQELGNIETREMFHTFNMGIGYVVVVPPGDVEKARRAAHGAIRIGEVIEGEAGVDLGI